MIKNNQKFVLAIPWGGFADNLKVMSKCYKYALKHNRILIVDGTNGQFRENYSNHFNLKNNVNNLIINYSEDIEKYLNTLSIYPKELSGRIGLFKARGGWIESNFKYIDPEKNTVLNFDFDINYSEDCLIHNWHGEQEDFSILETLTFSESLKSRLNQIRSEKFEPYDAIHIRCTDKYVDFRSFFSEIRNNLENESLLVCSDNKEVIGYAKEFFIEKKIWTATTLPDVAGAALHDVGVRWQFNLDNKKMNEDMLLDLMSISNAKNIFYPGQSKMKTDDGEKNSGPSGFSRMADYIKNTPGIMDGLCQ